MSQPVRAEPTRRSTDRPPLQTPARRTDPTPLRRRRPQLLWVILAIAAALRVVGLEHAPPPLNQDEASRAYDAWCLLETGADRHGRPWPFFLESFGPGDYTAALSVYLTVPFVALLGPSVTAVRLPDALLGVATIALLYAWWRRQADGTTAILAATVLALDPWHIALSRTAHESGFAPFFLVAALMGLCFAGLLPEAEANSKPSRGRVGGRAAWASFAGVMLAMHTWIYPATRLFTPVFVLIMAALYARPWIAQGGDPIREPPPADGVPKPSETQTGRRRRATRPVVVAAVLGLALGAAPLWLTAWRHPDRLAARSNATLLIHQDLSWGGRMAAFFRNYAANLDPRYQFLQADEMSGASIPGVGQHLVVLAPLWLIGLIRILADLRRKRSARLLLAWLLLYPLPAAVCSDWNPHPMRTVAGLALFPIITAIGARGLIGRLAGRSRRVRRIATATMGLALAANVAHFCDAYFRRFPPAAEGGYQTDLVRAFAFVASHRDEADFVLVTNWCNQPYIYALLAEPIPPTELARSPAVTVAGPRGFHQVLAVGRYLFSPIDGTHFPEARRRFQDLLARLPAGSRGWVIDVDRPGAGPAVAGAPLYRSGDGAEAAAVGGWPSYVVRRWSLPEPWDAADGSADANPPGFR